MPLTAPVRQVETEPTSALRTDPAPQAAVIALIGAGWPAAEEHGDALPVLYHEHRDREGHDQLDHRLPGELRHVKVRHRLHRAAYPAGKAEQQHEDTGDMERCNHLGEAQVPHPTSTAPGMLHRKMSG